MVMKLKVNDCYICPGGIVLGFVMFGLVDVLVYVVILVVVGCKVFVVIISCFIDFMCKLEVGKDLIVYVEFLKYGKVLMVIDVCLWFEGFEELVVWVLLIYFVLLVKF